MEMRNLGGLARQHYEKLILTVALLVLAGAILFLNQARVEEKEKIQAIPGDFEKRVKKPVPLADVSMTTQVVQQVSKPANVVLSPGHNLFNPVEWRLDRTTQLPKKIVSEKDVGPQAMQIVAVKPLHLQIVYGMPTTSGSDDQLVVLGYLTYTTNEVVAPRGREPRLVRAVVNVNETNRQQGLVFNLREVKGEPREPTELIGEFKDSGEKFSFAPGRPFTKVLTYEAELRYPPTPEKKYTNVRTNSPVDIEGQIYIVIDITPERVVLSDNSNGKQYSITKK